MSNALVIAHVTQALALLIENSLRPEIDMAVSVETRKPPAEPPTDPTINVFLFQVTPNSSMRNNDLPTRSSDGTLMKRPAAALDLHYVISAYGEETELVGQRLIGSVVRTLHETPVLPHDVIEAVADRPYLEGSDLADSPQRVRFVPQVMDVDETSKLWGMLYQTPYALSVVYQAALVLIDGREKPVPARPVERSTVTVLPFGAPGAPVPPVLVDTHGPGNGPTGDGTSSVGPPAVGPSTSDGAEDGSASGPGSGRRAPKATAKAVPSRRPAAKALPAKATSDDTGDAAGAAGDTAPGAAEDKRPGGARESGKDGDKDRGRDRGDGGGEPSEPKAASAKSAQAKAASSKAAAARSAASKATPSKRAAGGSAASKTTPAKRARGGAAGSKGEES